MLRALYGWLLLVSLVPFGAAALLAQTSPTDDKTPEPIKAVESAKPKLTLDKMTLPPGGVVVVVEELREAISLLPKMILMAPDEYQKLLERVAFLEKQLKGDK